MNQFIAGLSGTEAFSVFLSSKSIPEIINLTTGYAFPFYHITLHALLRLGVAGEIAVRGLSFFCYLLIVFFVYKIGSYLWGRNTGLLAAVLTFFNPFMFIHAFSGQEYLFLALGVAASMNYFIRIVYARPLPQKGKSKKAVYRLPLSGMLGFIPSTLLAVYSHPSAFIIVLLQGVWLIWELARGLLSIAKWPLISYIAVGLLYIPWFSIVYGQAGADPAPGAFDPYELRNLIYKYLGRGISHDYSRYTLYFVVLALFTRKWLGKYKQTLFAASWFLFPVFFAWYVSQQFRSIFDSRLLMYTIPGAMLVLASNQRRTTAGIVIGILIGLFVVIDWNFFTHPSSLPLRELAAYLHENKRGDDYIVIWNSDPHHLWESKYYGISAPLYLPENTGQPGDTALMTEDDIVRDIPGRPHRVGVIADSTIAEIVIPGYTENEVSEFRGLKFVWLTK